MLIFCREFVLLRSRMITIFLFVIMRNLLSAAGDEFEVENCPANTSIDMITVDRFIGNKKDRNTMSLCKMKKE